MNRHPDDVRRRMSEPWTTGRMPDEAGLSVTGLHRHVHAATGLSPEAWLIAERVRQARTLLENTSLSVEAVARDVGFGGAMNLRKHFQRAVGLPPTAYRPGFDAAVRVRQGRTEAPRRPLADVSA